MNQQVTKNGERLILGEHAYREYCLHIEPGITLADLLRPEMWKNNTDGRLRPNDRVRVISATEGYDVYLNVVGVMPGAGLIVEVYGEKSGPGTPMGEKLRAAEVAVRAETRAGKQAAIDAAIAGGRL